VVVVVVTEKSEKNICGQTHHKQKFRIINAMQVIRHWAVGVLLLWNSGATSF